MSLDDEIEALRHEIHWLERERAQKQVELDALYLQKARTACPIPIGARVEYEPGKFGQVDCVGFEKDWDGNFDWTVTGKKINKDGRFGKKNFHPVGPMHCFVKGLSFKAKGIGGHLGITGPDDDD